ncbi:MAG: HD domain-containing protein [Abditibacteriota bacterium]|nr:HD domain-containing protein [Abditibacteriota bacterium]
MKDIKTYIHNHQKLSYTVLLCVMGLCINFIGYKIAHYFDLPLYLDIIGNALSAALGGYIPAFIVGLFTNLINGLSNYYTAYYSFISMLIAISAAWFAQRGYFDRLSTLPIIIVTFALIGGIFGTMLNWVLNGFWIGEGSASGLAYYFSVVRGIPPFYSLLLADLLVDFFDKTISVIITVAIVKLLPESFKSKFYFFGFRKTKVAPLEDEEGRPISDRKKMSLRTKVVLLVSGACIIIASFVSGISYKQYRTGAVDQQIYIARSILHIAAKNIDAEKIEEYLVFGEDAEGYRESERQLKTLMDSADNIEYVYAYKVEPDGCHVVFDPDTADTPGEDPGTVIPFDEAFMKVLPKLLAGEPIDPVISNERYGWLLSVYEPLRDKEGRCRCYLCVDVNMNYIAITGYQFLARVISLFFGVFIVLLTLAIWLAEQNIILPVNRIAETASQFDYSTEDSRYENVSTIAALDIRTGDEIENLYNAIVRTTKDTVKFIGEMKEQEDKINKLQTGLILVLADTVEQRDQCTGDHVQKTAAYAELIMEELQRRNMYTDVITEEFKKNVTLTAALHDVGKIKVPDRILNKPGKLTDEEFADMKRHAVYGGRIIRKAIRLIGDADSGGYFADASNLARYHHEKWNGMGYPEGLKGEEIPLAARIMAVADVFDALVSERPYKKGFSFEKAMSIIEEGSGSHFDPTIATVFLEAGDKVREIMTRQEKKLEDDDEEDEDI